MAREEPLNVCVRVGKEFGLVDAIPFPISSVKLANWVHLKCKFGCDSYGKNYSCPPFVGTPRSGKKVVEEYKRGILLIFKSEDPKKTKDYSKRFLEIYKGMLKIEKELFLNNYYKVLALSSGPCPLCKKCSYPKYCAHLKDRRPAIEALGIDVLATVRKIGHEPTTPTEKEAHNTYCMILLE